MKNERLIELFALLFVGFWSFNNVWNWPVVGQKIQPPELFFLLLAAVSVPHLPEIFRKATAFGPIEKGLAALIGVVVFHAFWLGGQAIWLEIVGLAYLLGVFWIFKWLASRDEPSVFIEKMARWALAGAGLTGFVGIVGWSASYFFGIEGAAYSAKRYYPYLGYFGRATGFSTSVDILVFTIAIGALAAIRLAADQKLPCWAKLAFWMMAGAAALSFSKNLFEAAAALVWSKNETVLGKKWPKWAIRSAITASLLIFLIPSHVLVYDQKTIDWPVFYQSSNALDSPTVFQIGDKTGHWTVYALFKKTSVEAGIEHFPFGVGPGRHLDWVKTLQKRGKIPAYFRPIDAHCLYTSTFGELGFLGFLALVGLFWAIFDSLKKVKTGLSRFDWAFLSAFFLLFALESLMADTLNFRAFWAFLGILAAVSSRLEPKPDA